MGKASIVIVLAEDRRHQRFIWRYLQRLGYSSHDVVYEDLPAGRGCGEQWVRERYAKEIAAYRFRSKKAKTALVVAIDADRGDVDRRLQQFRKALADTAQESRSDGERIAHLIPKRSIETWILCLNSREVNEDVDYSREDVDRQIQGAAMTFFNWTRQNYEIPRHCIPSLRSGISEAKRLE